MPEMLQSVLLSLRCGDEQVIEKYSVVNMLGLHLKRF